MIGWVEIEIGVTETEILDVAEAAIGRETTDEAVTEIVAIGTLVHDSKSQMFFIHEILMFY